MIQLLVPNETRKALAYLVPSRSASVPWLSTTSCRKRLAQRVDHTGISEFNREDLFCLPAVNADEVYPMASKVVEVCMPRMDMDKLDLTDRFQILPYKRRLYLRDILEDQQWRGLLFEVMKPCPFIDALLG